MKHKKILFALLISIFIVAASGICVAETRILFYEASKVSGSYKSGAGYLEFKEALEGKGYSVSRYEKALSREVLDNYNPDVLIITQLNSPLDASELAAIFEFVMQDGKGLFISGGTPSVNQITIPFGMTIDTGTLEDESNPIWDSSSGKEVADKTNFVIHTIERQEPLMRPIIQGIDQLAFFGGNGISLRDDPRIKRVIMGDWDTYSPQSPTFPKGSKPPLASAALVGKGCVFLLSDADMLANDKVDTSKYKYDNLKLGTNIIEWLRACAGKPDEDLGIEELMFMISHLNNTMSDLNRTNIGLQETIQDKNNEINGLNRENADLSAVISELRRQVDPVLSIKYNTWAIILLAIGILLIAVVMSRRAKKPETTEDEFGGFGYEFEEGEEGFETSTEELKDLVNTDKDKSKKE